MLPVPLSAIVWSKVFGSLARVMPAVLCFGVGVAYAPDRFTRDIEDVIDEPIAWFFFCQIVLGIFLTTFYSLGTARGALVRAAATIALIDVVFGMFMTVSRGGDEEFVVGFMAFLFADACVPVISGIAWRLRTRARQ